MAQWKWAGLQVLDDWDSGKDSRAATAAIYFHASEPGGPDAPGTLYLARVVGI
ncbi:hypothetical protein [Candidatus Poriferisocius sp.]|uniref:hypothetical protein n=1 Tax=Candidatus Poriferisocius sp. TaxID=3101276 RepID=UPI003B02A30A